jgi:hypothetical protein
MPLSDEEKSFIQAQIQDLAKVEGTALHSLLGTGFPAATDSDKQFAEITKAALEFKAEAANQLASITKAALEKKAQDLELSKAQQKELYELQIYKWVIRGLFIVLLGGSIYGFLKFQPFIDERIALRFQKSDRLTLAMANASSGARKEALQAIDGFYENIKSGRLEETRDYKDFVYSTMIWFMSQDDENLSDGISWVGQEEWLDLWKNQDFLRYYITGSWLPASDSDLNNLALCFLKFEQTDDAIQKAESYFGKAIAASHIPAKQSPRYFGRAMIVLIQGDSDRALDNLKQAELFDPAGYALSDFTKNIGSYKNSYDYRIYNIAARRKSVEDFGPRLDALVGRVKVQNPQK